MEKAKFSLVKFHFDKVKMDFSNMQGNDLNLEIIPSGKLVVSKEIYTLTFEFKAINCETEIVKIRCIAEFRFQDLKTERDIPEYFYANSIAIVFPYVRAFVSTVTLQANIRPIIIPTMNLSDLGEQLKINTANAEG